MADEIDPATFFSLRDELRAVHEIARVLAEDLRVEREELEDCREIIRQKDQQIRALREDRDTFRRLMGLDPIVDGGLDG